VGIPFTAAVFEKHGDHWLDFVGPLTHPAYIGNVLFALVLPQLAFCVWRRGTPKPRV
jgi:hypothetical protein